MENRLRAEVDYVTHDTTHCDELHKRESRMLTLPPLSCGTKASLWIWNPVIQKWVFW